MFKTKNKSNNRFAFTLVEILVVVAIIGTLITVGVVYFNSAREGSRDARRVADINQIQTALEAFYYHQGRYPTTEEFGTSSLAYGDVIYLKKIPTPPEADGDCSEEENAYTYSSAGINNGSYTLTFCLGSSSGDLTAGYKSAGPDKISPLASLPEPDDPMIATLLNNYKTRVESAGGALVDETAAYNLMKQIYDADLYSNLKLHISSDLGFKLPASQANFAFKENWNNASLSPYYSFNTTVNSISGGILTVTSANNDPSITMSSLGSFDPNVYKYIEVRYRVVSGTAGVTQIFFLNSRRASANADQYVNSPTMVSDGQWHTMRFYMGGHQYWTNSNITGWRYDWNTTASVQMELDYIGLTDGLGNFVAYDFSSSENDTLEVLEDYQPPLTNLGMEFDGSGDYVDFGNPSEINFGTGDFSVGFWMYRNDNATTNLRPLSKGADGDDVSYAGFAFFGSNTSLNFIVNPTGPRVSVGASGVVVGNWHYVVGVVDRDGLMSIYLDGVLKSTTSAPSGSVSGGTYPLYIGRRAYANTVCNWDGYVDNVHLFDKALSADEINIIYDATKSKYD